MARFLERTNEFLLRMSLVEDDATLKTCFLFVAHSLFSPSLL